MTAAERRQLRSLEGRSVHVSLRGGSRLDEVSLVSARGATLWLFSHGEDAFVPVDEVVEVWGAAPVRPAA